MKTVLIFGASGDTGRYLVRYLIEKHGGMSALPSRWKAKHADAAAAAGIAKSAAGQAQSENAATPGSALGDSAGCTAVAAAVAAGVFGDIRILTAGHRAKNEFAMYGIPYYQVDITDPESLKSLPTDVDCVIDFAGLMPARMKGYVPQRYFEINTIGTLNILEYCREKKIPRFMFATSFGDIRGNIEKPDPDTVLRPDSPILYSYTSDHTAYVISKRAACELIENYHQKFGLETVIFRLPTIYLWSESNFYYVDGEKRKLGYKALIDRAIAGEDIEIWGDPKKVKDMVYAKDYAQMVDLAIFGNVTHALYNVGCGVGTTLEDQICDMIEVFGNPSKSHIIPRPDKSDAPQYVMDISAAVRDLGYQPKYDCRSMYEDMKREIELAAPEGV